MLADIGKEINDLLWSIVAPWEWDDIDDELRDLREALVALGSLIELVVIVAIALGVALGIQAFLVKPFRIPSESMVPTLEIGQRVLVNRVGEHFGDPERGDVMVFKPPQGADDNMCGVSHPPEQRCPRSSPGVRAR